MRSEILLLLLAVCFSAILVTRKYVSRTRFKNTDILAWQHEYSHGRIIEGVKDNCVTELSFCKNIESRKLQVT